MTTTQPTTKSLESITYELQVSLENLNEFERKIAKLELGVLPHFAKSLDAKRQDIKAKMLQSVTD